MSHQERVSLLSSSQQQPSSTTAATTSQQQDNNGPSDDVDFSAQAAKEVSHYETDRAGTLGNWSDSCSLPFIFSIFLISIPLLWFILIFQNVYMNPFNYSPDFEWIGPQHFPTNDSTTIIAANNGSLPFSHSFIETNVNEHFPKLLSMFGIAGAQLVLVDTENVGDDAVGKYRIRPLSFGQRDIYFTQVNSSVTNHTLFQVGEISETATAFGIMKLVQDGRILSIHSSANSYLKRGLLLDLTGAQSNDTTILNLLTHTSGTVDTNRYESFYGQPSTGRDRVAFNDVFKSVRVDKSKVGTVSTSRVSVGSDMAILQALIEDVTGQNFTGWINLNVLNPLGLSLSTFDTDDVANIRTFSSSYGSYFYAIPEYSYSVPAGFGLYSCGIEMANILIAGMNAGVYGNAVLDADHTEQLFAYYEYNKQLEYSTSMSLGSQVEELSDGSLTNFQSGHNLGWHTHFAFNKQHKQGFIILTNTETATPILDIFHCYWEYQMTGDQKNNACLRVNDRAVGNLAITIVTWLFAVVLFVIWCIMSSFICHSKVPITCQFPFLTSGWLETASSASVLIRFIIVVITSLIYMALMVFLHSDIYGLIAFNVPYVIFAVKFAPFYLPFSSLVFGFFCMTFICIALFVYRVVDEEKKEKNYQRIN